MGQAMLGVLDLLDSNWGRGRCDEAAGFMRFGDQVAVGRYNTLMAELRQAGTEQAAAQKRFAEV
jgi:hypothetical protein